MPFIDNLWTTHPPDAMKGIIYITNLIQPLLVLFMIAPQIDKITTERLFLYFSLISPNEIDNYNDTALLTLKNIEKH